MSNEQIGQRFSHLYLNKGDPETDSMKARYRLAKLVENSYPKAKHEFRKQATPNYNRDAIESIEAELGVQFASQSTEGGFIERWDLYFNRITVLEMLDSITVIANSPLSNDARRGEFIEGARRIFKEENLAYEVDAEGGIHPLIDAEFSLSMQSSIAGLSDARYAASRECLKKIDECLMLEPKDFVGAIRAVFGACENTFKLMYKALRLDSKAAGACVGPDQQRFYEGHPTMQRVSARKL